MDEPTALLAFAALSNGTRLKIVRALVEAGSDGLAAGDIAEVAEASPSRTSFHLAGLAEAGLVTSDRQSRSIRYRVAFTQLGALMRFVLEDCCKGNAQVRYCCTGGHSGDTSAMC